MIAPRVGDFTMRSQRERESLRRGFQWYKAKTFGYMKRIKKCK